MEKEKISTGSNINTPYDDAFRTLLNDCSRLVIPVVNELFGKQYRGDETIYFHPNEHFINLMDGNEEKRITDGVMTIIDRNGEEAQYLIECQSRPDSSMLVRIFEYVTQVALDRGVIRDNVLVVTIPHAAVLFLRSGLSPKEDMSIQIRTPGGEVEFMIPVLRMRDYALRTILERKLYFLLPFYIFTHEARFAELNEDPEKLETLKSEYAWIMETLDQSVEQREMTVFESKSIQEMSRLVLDHISKKYGNVRKGVNSVMGGKVLMHESKAILNEGIAQGIAQGVEQGVAQGVAQGIRGLMKNMGLSMEQAMNVLEVPESDRKACRELLERD